jgi:hypothetical protein
MKIMGLGELWRDAKGFQSLDLCIARAGAWDAGKLESWKAGKLESWNLAGADSKRSAIVAEVVPLDDRYVSAAEVRVLSAAA